jgi:hypothetical protein
MSLANRLPMVDELHSIDGTTFPPRSRLRPSNGIPLLVTPSVIVRSREEQQPDAADKPLLELAYQHLKNPSWRDGGRDAIGDFLLGLRPDPVAVELMLEAKCYPENHDVVSARRTISSHVCSIGSSGCSSPLRTSTSRRTGRYVWMGTLLESSQDAT